MSESNYLDLEPDINRVQHLEELESILDKADVDKERIILYGSSIMALYGIKENDDLEFIPHPEEREKFIELAKQDKESEFSRGNHILFPNKIRAVYVEDRMAPFNWSDKELFENEKCFIEYKGYKFMKLELLVSLKAAKRRPKDLRHIEMLEDGGHIGGPGWDWDLVHHLPPWERPDLSNSLLEIGKASLKKYGVMYTLLKGPGYVTSKVASKALNKADVRSEKIKDKSQELKESIEPYLGSDSEYCVPDFLNRQFDENGEFERYDLLASLLYLEGYKEFKEFFESIDSGEELSATSQGSISGGVTQLSRKLNNILENSSELSDAEVDVKISKKPKLSSKRYSWAEKRFGKEKADKLENRKEKLLENAGVYFYAMLWPSVEKHHDEIEGWIRERIDVVDTIDLDLGDNMHEFLESVYSVDKRPAEWEKERKVIKIQSFGSKVRILKIRTENPEYRMAGDEKLSDRIHSLKQECRKKFQDKLENYEYGMVTHFTDNYEHNAHNAELISEFKQ